MVLFLEFGMPTVALKLGNGGVFSKTVDYGCELRERSTNFYLVINGMLPMRFNMFIRVFGLKAMIFWKPKSYRRKPHSHAGSFHSNGGFVVSPRMIVGV